MKRWSAVLLASLLFPLPLLAHEVRPAYLGLREISPETYDVLWKVPARGEGSRLGLSVRFPEDTSSLSDPVGAFAGDCHLERWRIRRAGGLTGAAITIDGLSQTVTDVLLRFERADGTSLTHRFTADAPTYVVEAIPSLGQVAWTYLGLGVEHILLGIDHLLFVLALILIVNGGRKLLITVTTFTLAHSVTLALATLGFVHVPGPPVEAIIALSIVFVASEIVHGQQGRPGLTARCPWIVAFIFGLLHGFGFAGALAALGLPERAIAPALLFFNVGVEAGQILFIAAVLVVARPLRRVEDRFPRAARMASAYGIGGLAMFWLIQRVAAF
jgi:hydrogenase/urease accessory protein HupE